MPPLTDPSIRQWAELRVWADRRGGELGEDAVLALTLCRLIDLCVGLPLGPSREQLWVNCMRLARWLGWAGGSNPREAQGK